MYRSSTIVAYWSFRNRDKYLEVQVAFILQNKKEIIVKIINDDVVSISAPVFASRASMACSALLTKTNESESELLIVKESCINKNAPDDDLRLKIEKDDKRKNLTIKCTPTYWRILHRELHIVTDDIENNDLIGFVLLTEQEKSINYARNCLKLANTLNYARVNYTEDVISVPLLDLNSESLIDELVVESEFCVANASCHDQWSK